MEDFSLLPPAAVGSGRSGSGWSGTACSASFRVALLYGIGFTGNVAVPRSVDHAPRAALGNAILIDLMLLGLFVFGYHVTSRSIGRRTEALFGSLALFLMYWQWRALPAVVWDVQLPAGRLGVRVVFWLSWATVVLGANAIRQFDWFELRIRYFMWRETHCGRPGFGSRLGRWPARHPVMSGLVIASWATPVMTAGHLLFAAAATGLIVAVVRREERGSRRRSALAAAVIAELSGTVFPALRRATVFPVSPVRPESSPPRRYRPSSLRPLPARRSG